MDKKINERILCNYSIEDINIMELRKQNILNELEILNITKKSVIYNNQDLIGSNIVKAFKNRKIINIMLISKTQSGKTGSMCATIKKYLEEPSNLIPIENFYIITGLSSCEWKEQTKNRMPESIQSRVYHRSELPKTFVNEIINKKNILIIMDEIQVAAKKKQTIYNAFKKAGILDKQKLYKNDIKILEYSATPDGTIYDLQKWKDASHKILADVGHGYVSSYDLLKQGRVKQYKDLYGYNKEDDIVNEKIFENIKEIKNDIELYFSTKKRYHIIRTKTGSEQSITIQNFKKIFNNELYDFINYDSENNMDINNLLIIEPLKHIFIFIKEMLRCAKTLNKKNIGILYDRYRQNPHDSTIIQGLIGRDTGYDNNGSSICYTNIDSIEKYEKLWESKFEDKTIKWKSLTTCYKKCRTSGKNTFNDPKLYKGFSDSEQNDENKEPFIKKFKTFQDAKEYCTNILKKTGPRLKEPNEEGFYFSKIRSVKKIYTCDEIYSERKQGLKETNYILHPCYKDKTNIETLEWWLIYYS